MSNGNGVWKLIVVTVVLGVMGFAGKAVVSDVDENRDDIKDNADTIQAIKADTDEAYLQLNRRMDSVQAQVRIGNGQLELIAKAVGAPVIVDTTRDSVP